MKKNVAVVCIAFLSLLAHGVPAQDRNLEKVFLEAFAAGRPFDAEQAFKTLTENRAALAPERYYQAAEISRQLGKPADRRTRLSHFIKVADRYDDSVEQAARELLRYNDDVAAFELLATKDQSPRYILGQAMRLLEVFRKRRLGADFLRVLEASLAVLKDGKDRERLIKYYCEALCDKNMPGQSDAEIRAFVMKHAGKTPYFFEKAFGERSNVFPAIWKLRLMESTGVLLSPWAFGRSVDIPKEDVAEAVRIQKAIAPLVFDGKHGMHAYQLIRLRFHLRSSLYTNVQTNERSKAFFDDLCKMAESANCYNRWETVGMIRDVARETMNYADRIAFRNRYPGLVAPDAAATWIFNLAGECRRAKSTRHYHEFAKKYPDQWGLRIAMRRDLAALGDFNEVCEYLVLGMVLHGEPNHHLFDALVNGAWTPEQRAALIREASRRTGAHSFWHWCKTDRHPVNHKEMKDPKVKAALAAVTGQSRSCDRLVEIQREMRSLRRGKNNAAPEQAHKLFNEAFKAFPGRISLSGYNGRLLLNITQTYIDLSREEHSSAVIASKALFANLAPYEPKWTLERFRDRLIHHVRYRRDVMSIVAKSTGDAGFLSEVKMEKGDAALPVPFEAFAKVGSWSLWRFLQLNFPVREREKRLLSVDTTRKVLAAAFSGREWKSFELNQLNGLIAPVAVEIARADPAAAAAAFPLDKIAAELEGDRAVHGTYVIKFFDICRACGKFDHYLDRYYSALMKSPPQTRAPMLVAFAENHEISPIGKPSGKSRDRFGELMTKYLLPTLKAIPSKYATMTWLGGDDARAGHRACEWKDSRRGDAAADKTVREFMYEMERLRRAGAGSGFLNSQGRGAWRYCSIVYSDALRATNAVELAKTAYTMGWSSTEHSSSHDYTLRLLERTRKAKMWDALYIFSNALRGENRKQVLDAASRYRAEASSHLKGVYPVSAKDPLYPLYVAADEFSRNNFERATELLTANLRVFEQGAGSLPPAFAAWAVDQMRIMRGDKDELLLRSRDIATRLLGDESRLTKELAAAMLLVRAESFRDQQNFEAAKLEYQTIRNNPAYSATPSGRRAMFRSMDLMIESGNTSSAEQTLEYWLSQNDSEIQAQAHYFLARIAFDRKDYDECAKRLREVFAIDYTHTEARFLHGRWKLATNSEVDETEVLVGSISDRTTVRPNQQLSITVQDRNLSVAGGGSSIPVVVTSVPNGDRELVRLMPSVRDPGLFRGAIDVVLAPAAHSNQVLEVTGYDTVSYQIDPEFLKARGLGKGAVKKLRVVDDARLAIGSGAPRVEEEDSAAQVEALLGDGGNDRRVLASALRPGNPLHIALSDKDRSTGAENCSVSVAVSTSSGDRLKNVELRETKPYSGIFRASVRTALPPPRAFASDTAVGYNPGDVINSRKANPWKSLADNRLGKWFAVDTMGSHLVSNIVIKMKNPEEITALKLSGKLGGDPMDLGWFPKGDVKSRLGLRLQVHDRRMRPDAETIREFMTSTSAPGSKAVTNLAFNATGHATVRYSGWFSVPEGVDFLRLKILPVSKSATPMSGFSAAVAVDGRTILSGSGPRMAGAIAPIELSVGVHRLEVMAVVTSRADAFKVVVLNADGSESDVDISWFDSALHPGILDVVSDRAVITRDAGGFTAVFPKPVRLRTVRWDFLGRRSPDITVDSISMLDSEGKTVLPVESDFSDAQDNDILEVAPGDRISVSYADERTSRSVQRKIEKSMLSRFTDASVGFFFEGESVPGSGNATLFASYRFIPGDNIVVSVVDADLDRTDAADTVDVTVSTRSGNRIKITLVEQPGLSESGGIHTGRFLGLLKTAAADSTFADVLKCVDNDELVLEYLDQENTSPGVPTVRTCVLGAVRRAESELKLFRTSVRRVVDDSPAARVKLNAIRRRPGNEDVNVIYRNVVSAEVMEGFDQNSTNAVTMNIDGPLLVRLCDPARARHSGSKLTLEASTAETTAVSEMRIGASFHGVELVTGSEGLAAALKNGSFNGSIRLAIGSAESAAAVTEGPSPSIAADGTFRGVLPVTGSQTVLLRVRDGDEIIAERQLVFAADATLDLVDSSLSAERRSLHCGERFYIMVKDADRDVSGEADAVEVKVKAAGSGVERIVELKETMPHSGVFSGTVRPVVATNVPPAGVSGTNSVQDARADYDDSFPVRFGDNLEFSYVDVKPFSSGVAGTLCVTGMVHKGSDGSLSVFSKRFSDPDQSVLVQFRLAECLFEQAKEYRARKQTEKSAEAIARGRRILEEALKNNPRTVHAAQGEFLLANLSQELAAESNQNGDKEGAKRLYSEAMSRFSSLLASAPQGEYAPRAQYHKALCLEMLGDFRRAAEEYVKMTYLYPQSDLVGDATVRLATHYYKNEKRYGVAARIYENFQKRFPNHSKAARALFMCGSCFVREGDRIQKENEKKETRGLSPEAAKFYGRAVAAFERVIEVYRNERPEMRAQALYWAGDTSFKSHDWKNCYLYLKRTILEYPETEWARRARGLLVMEAEKFEGMED